MDVDDSSFSNNTCTENIGGAIACALHGVGSLQVSDSLFDGNYAGEAGGAIETHAYGTGVSITGCRFTNNMTSNGGAIRSQEAPFSCSESEFIGNKASIYTSNQTQDGGAICLQETADVLISECNFRSNLGTSGGAVILNTENMGEQLIIDCLFEDNIAVHDNPVSGGGAIKLLGSGIMTLIDSCNFKENQCPSNGNMGTAISLWEGQVTYRDSEFCGHLGVLFHANFGGSFLDDGANDISDICGCEADVDSDGVINVNDVLIVLAEYGTSNPLGDVNSDGIVNVNDVLIVVATWGPCEG